MITTIQLINNFVKNSLWILSYQVEEKRIATNAKLAKFRINTRKSIRRLEHVRR